MFMNTEKDQIINLSQRVDLKSLNKHVAFENLSIYYT